MTEVFFFKGDRTLAFDRGEDRRLTPTTRIADRFPGLGAAGFGHAIDAALNLDQGFVYFFQGRDYLRFDIRRNAPDMARLPIKSEWNGFEQARLPDGSSFAEKVDAAVNWGNGKAYFFRRDHYIRYDIAQDHVDVFPTPIRKEWTGFAEAKAGDGTSFADGVDAAVAWGNGKAYFFRKDAYLRYDMFDDRVDAGWPKPIGTDHVTGEENWPGLKGAGFGESVRGAIDLFPSGRMFVGGAEVMEPPVSVERPKFLSVNFKGRTVGTPWRGVLHCTDGDNLAGAIATFSGNNFWPHFTIEPNTGRIVQHISLSQGSRALKGAGSAGVLTNQAHAIQIEIVGRLPAVRAFTPAHNDFIRRVMLDIEARVPIPRRSGLTFRDEPALKSNELKKEAWLRFSGWCGHQHTPGGGKPCPGPLNIRRLVAPNV